MSKIEYYVNDIPMRLSNSSRSSNINDLLSRMPYLPSTLNNYDYSFATEKIALEDAQREGERILYEASLRFDKLELEQARINGSNVSYSTASISKLQVNLTDEPVYSISPVPQSLPPKPLQPPAQPYPTKVGPSIAPLTTNVTRMTDILQPTTTTTIVNHNVINRNGVASDVDISSHNQSKNENGSSSSAYDTNKNHLASLINPADFENTTASPFDDALLRSIDDKQELTSVFQQAYLTQTFPNHN